MYYHPKRLPVNEDRIIKHRHYEDDLRDRLIRVHDYEGLMRRAEFEQSNEPKTCYRTLSERLEAIRAQREKAVSNRRNRMKQLLDAETEAIDDEMKTGNMNLAERRAWLEAEARRMRTERLERMQKYAQTQLERSFRDSSDDVRIHNSKLAVVRAEEERKRQRKRNIERRAKAKEDELALHKSMELEWQRQDELHREELELKEARKQEAIDILHEQLGMVRRLREEERTAVEEDMINMNKRWLEEEEDLKRKQYEQRQIDSQKARRMLLFNEHNRVKKLAEVQEEKKYDAHMIAMVAEREAEEERQEKELREAQRREARAYAAQLKAAIDRQKVEDDELEAVIKAELEEDWRKRDEQTRQQEDARKQLYDEVYEGRTSQIQFKETLKKEQEEEKLAQLEKYKADAERFRLEDQKRAEDLNLGCERDAIGAGPGVGKELDKTESYMRLSWALVHSRQVSDVQRGILMLEASLDKNPDEVQQREILYLLAVGNYRAGDIPRARRYIDRALEITPDFRQGLTLRKLIEDKIAKDGVIGIGIAAAAASVVAGGIAALLVKKR